MPKRDPLQFAIEVARIAHDNKSENVVALDLRGKSAITDFTVIATGTSERHRTAIGPSAGAATILATGSSLTSWTSCCTSLPNRTASITIWSCYGAMLRRSNGRGRKRRSFRHINRIS